MSNVPKVIIAILAVIIIAGGVWLFTSNKKAGTPANTPQDTTQNDNQSNDNAEVAATISYTAAGFSPASSTVKSGQKVKIVNDSDETIEFASDPHPTHTNNSELNTSDIAPGESTTITVTTTGEWGFHNHYDPTKRGTLTVE